MALVAESIYVTRYPDLGSVLPLAPKRRQAPRWLHSEGWLTSAARSNARRRGRR